jgi:photosystem II stability/assembly factor-like uncharacterized protein
MLVVSAAPDAPRTLYGAGYRGLFESADGGKTWLARRGLPEGIRVKALLPRPHGVILAGTDQGLFRGDANTWKRVAAVPANSIQSAGTHALVALTASAALVSEDEGVSWSDCGTPAPGISWYGMALDTAANGVALAATSRGVFRSADGCRSWTAVASGLETQATAEAVLFHPTRAGEAFVAQGGRVFTSMDGGQHWQALEDGGDEELWPSSLLILTSAPNRLFALVPGRGVFSTTAFALPAVTQHTY